VDLAAASGARIGSPAPGVLSFAGIIAGRGVAVVTHAGGLRTTYEPVRPVVAVGTVVASGRDFAVLDQGIRHCGATTCLHWGAVHRDGGGRDTYLDPLGLLGAPPPVVLLPLTGPEDPVRAGTAAGP
jgi:murein DD-endopeptidase MepM/ murein hydrolase activator NlpD